MKEALKASADFYFDGPGWIVMGILAALIATQLSRRKLWLPVLVVLLAIPFGLLFFRQH